MIERYPNRDNYLQDVIPLNELTRQIKQRGGIYLAMLDYSPVVTANKSNVLQLLWTEVPFIQVWTNFRRGDHRPPFLIQHDRGTPEYCREIAFHYNNYKDDNQRLRELLLGLERKKNEALTKSHTAFERQASAKLSATESMVRSFNLAQLKGEMEDDRLPQFAEDADRAYSNALLHHYKNFTTNTPLLGDEILTAIYNRIKSLFPMHFTCLHSMLYGKRSLEPARVTSPNNLRKQFMLVHYFFCLMRERDNHHMPHWAMIATIALHYRGVDSKCYRNTHMKSSTINIATALGKMDEIFEKTEADCKTLFQAQRFLTSSLDNYNRFQRFTLQRSGTSGVFHNGIVYDAVRAKEFNRPIGTILI